MEGDLVLLHEVADGPADRSYGIAVARLAGLPPPFFARKAVLCKAGGRPGEDRRHCGGLDDLPLFAASAEVKKIVTPIRYQSY